MIQRDSVTYARNSEVTQGSEVVNLSFQPGGMCLEYQPPHQAKILTNQLLSYRVNLYTLESVYSSDMLWTTMHNV